MYIVKFSYSGCVHMGHIFSLLFFFKSSRSYQAKTGNPRIQPCERTLIRRQHTLHSCSHSHHGFWYNRNHDSSAGPVTRWTPTAAYEPHWLILEFVVVSDIVTVRIVQYAALFPVKCDRTTDGDFHSSVSTALGYVHTMHFVRKTRPITGQLQLAIRLHWL